MKTWTCRIAALTLCLGAATADAGLFDCFKNKGGCHDDGCCPTCAAPEECCPDPSCCAPEECCPEPTCCAPSDPACCAPAECCPEEECCPEPSCCAPSCCAPADPSCCADECADECGSSGCGKKKGGLFSKLFGCLKPKRGCLGHGDDCCPEECCPVEECCEEPACGVPACN